MILIVAGMVALTVALAFWLAARPPENNVVLEVVPDGPVAFGRSMAWLAIRTTDRDAVVEALGLFDPIPCSWNSGIGTVYDEELGAAHIFVTPPVDGWTFVVGLPLPHPVGRGFVDKCTPLLLVLGEQFREAQYFFSYPLIDFYAWARARGKRMSRAFATTDEGVIWNKGRTSKEERALGLKAFELRGVRGRSGDAGGELILHPTEDHVLQLAARWSLDPTRLGSVTAPAALGYVALAPSSWRPERIRKIA